MERMVLGFFTNNARVALILKKTPPWQCGYYNGIGGHIEEDETPEQAMTREFQEEAGCTVSRWEQKLILTPVPDVMVHVFVAYGVPEYVRSTGAERVRVFRLDALPKNIIPNVPLILGFILGDKGGFNGPKVRVRK